MKALKVIPILTVITMYLIGASISTGATPGAIPRTSTQSGSVRPTADHKPSSILAECARSENATHDTNVNEIKNRYNTAVQGINNKYSDSEKGAKAAYDAAAKAANDEHQRGLKQADAVLQDQKKKAQEWLEECLKHSAYNQCKPTYDSRVQSAIQGHSASIVNLKSALASALSKARTKHDAAIQSAKDARDMALKNAKDNRDMALNLEKDRNAKALEKCRAR